MKFKKIKNESTEAELVNDKEYGPKLYEIGLWWGSGYVLDMYKAYANSEEQALNYVVAYVEKTHPKWLETSDKSAENLKHDIMNEYEYDEFEAEESVEFAEQFDYIDATMEGAKNPHFIWIENLLIRQIGSSTSESTRKLVKEGAGAGYEIEIKDVEIDKVIKFEESDYKSEYSSEKWYKYEATIKPGEYEIDASTHYDSLVHDYDNNVVIESGTIYGEIGIWEDEDDERSLEEKIREEIEGNKHTIKTMYGAGWLHAYLPKDGNIEFDKITDYTPSDCLYTIEKFKFKSTDMANVINYNYDHIGEDDDNDAEEVDESSKSDGKMIEDAIPVDAKDGLVGCQYSPKDGRYLVVFAPSSMREVKSTLSEFLNLGWDAKKEPNYKGYSVISVNQNASVNESMRDGFTTNKKVTAKVDELVQAVWEDAKKEQKLEAFHMFEKSLSKAINDYWDRIA